LLERGDVEAHVVWKRIAMARNSCGSGQRTTSRLTEHRDDVILALHYDHPANAERLFFPIFAAVLPPCLNARR
jgi:hypothetical protein